MGITLSFFVYLLPLVLDLKLLLFSCSIMSDSLRPHELQQARLPCLHYLLEFAQTHAIELMNPSNCLILCCLLLLLPSIFPSIRVFQWVGSLHQVAKALNFSINPSSEYSGLISFRIDWFELAIQGTLKSFLQHSSKASILWHSDFFMIQLSHPYITTGKIIVLTYNGHLINIVYLMVWYFCIHFHLSFIFSILKNLMTLLNPLLVSPWCCFFWSYSF